MKKTLIISSGIILSLALAGAVEQKTEPISLPAPQMERGKALMPALKNRQSMRNLASGKLPLQELGNILWAACGINRPDSGKRTAPTACNWQEIDVYVALPGKVFIFMMQRHTYYHQPSMRM